MSYPRCICPSCQPQLHKRPRPHAAGDHVRVRMRTGEVLAGTVDRCFWDHWLMDFRLFVQPDGRDVVLMHFTPADVVKDDLDLLDLLEAMPA